MKNNIEETILEKFKMNIALDNFRKEINNNTFPEEERRYIMRKKILATACISFVLVSGIVLATNIKSIKHYFRKLGNGMDSAIEHGYISNTEMDYEKSNTDVSTQCGEIIDNINVEAKIENFLMDDYNLSTEFSFKFDDKINEYINIDNIHNIELKDLIIRDEENRILYAGNDKEAFESYCQEYNLPYIFGECNENYLNNGLNNFPSLRSKENNLVKLMYNMYAEKYPKSKKLYFSFGKITFLEENSDKILTLKGDWQIELDVPEKMYNRTSESYKVVGCNNDDFEVYYCEVSDTGLEIGIIINNIEEPKKPKELEDEILSKYAHHYDSMADIELRSKLSESPYKEIYNEYQKKTRPILTDGTYVGLIGLDAEDSTGKCYVENSNGQKFECTFSPSRKYKLEWLNGNKYNYYETFGMTKYDATDNIKVFLNYYGKPVEIELGKIKINNP